MIQKDMERELNYDVFKVVESEHRFIASFKFLEYAEVFLKDLKRSFPANEYVILKS